jgi:TolA-binding protein
VAYPATPHAPEALLRLGQGLVSAAMAGTEPDAARRAVAWLQRLINDYPTAPARPTAFLWLARALHADGRTPAACTRLQQAPIAAADSITASLIESDRRRLCNDLVPAPHRP